jgi:coenzyme F420-reducing hydrogenase alpha subunit
MKIRNSFVSNSSSSSFVAFVDKKDYEEAFKQLKDEEKRILGFFPPENLKYKKMEFVKLMNNQSDGELHINEKYIDEDDLEDIFPEEFRKRTSSKNRYYNQDKYEIQQNISNAFNSLMELLKGKTLEHSDYY